MPGRKNRLLDAALAYAAAGVPVTPAHRVVPLDGGRAWRRRWECACGLAGCPDAGAHPVGDARRVLSTELVAELWGGQEPPGLLISPSATIDVWRMPRELGALGLRLLEAQRPSIWPPLLHRPDGSWAACTRPLAEPAPVIETYGLRVEKLGPGDLLPVPPTRHPRGRLHWLWSQRFPHTPLPEAAPLLAALSAAAMRLQPWELRDVADAAGATGRRATP